MVFSNVCVGVIFLVCLGILLIIVKVKVVGVLVVGFVFFDVVGVVIGSSIVNVMVMYWSVWKVVLGWIIGIRWMGLLVF